ncbi:MAG: bifunctional alpha,alpha-trehalose-phosphate synthase (UDP-forming)/trehalose-phosphatase [Bacteroidia bacterium]|nr:MAG: bifunctional alpha,alpha-trehalose-phosphate synthase (UDP-forming)/trehalose-phosphatase [Bacteroidia bacterium]
MRLLIVSNRLPVALSKENGKYTMAKSAGGLVSGLSDYLNSLGNDTSEIKDYIWMGWPGTNIEKNEEEEVRRQVQQSHKASPVFLSKKLMDNVYLGFCNRTIWPLFHYFPNYARFDLEYWHDYKRMNEIFRDELLKEIQKDDIIWIHDYHLMLLPAMLREKVSNPIGFFLHIPFPSYELYRMLHKESRLQILNGLLGADLIGFHTHDYTVHFLKSVLRIVGKENHMGKISMPDHTVEVNTFPMGIDFNKFHTMDVSPHPSVKPDRGKPKIVLSVDRLDYSKGIVNRLKGFELFLEKNPEWHGKVCMHMIVVPSRTGVGSYRKIKSQLDELVGQINGNFGNMSWMPVIYQYTSLPHKELIAQYRMSHVALLTPLRDGMNLVAKEYVASLTDQKGVLIISEFAGAAKEMSESLVINPNNIDEIADAIAEALRLPMKDQVRGNRIMQKRLKRYDVTKWATDFVDMLLKNSRISRDSVSRKLLSPKIQDELFDSYQKAVSRIIIVNYDGTLVPYTRYPASAEPSGELLSLLRDLETQEKTDIVIISGRGKEELEEWFGDLPLNLTAEHGSWIREAANRVWRLLKPLSSEWKEEVVPILETYTDRLPGSYVQEREYSVAWHYHKSDIEQASQLVKEVNDHLLSITTNISAHVIHGSKVIEVSNSGINKGELAMHWLSRKQYDFILAIGAGWSDELLFQTMPEHAWPVKVGLSQTSARYVVKKQSDAIALLDRLRAGTGK